MLRNIMVLSGCLVLGACEQVGENELSLEGFEEKIIVEHVYDVLNPYAIESRNAKIIIDVPRNIDGHQKIFNLTSPGSVNLYQKNDGEQYVEVQLANLPAKQKSSVVVKYTLAQNPGFKLKFFEESSNYESIFTTIMETIERVDAESFDYPKSLGLIKANWGEFEKRLPFDLDELNAEAGLVDVVQKIVAADYLLSNGVKGEILIGFACKYDAVCDGHRPVMWFEYAEGGKVNAVDISRNADTDVNMISIKKIRNVGQINDFFNGDGHAESVGVVLN